jgi:hypothetical protein
MAVIQKPGPREIAGYTPEFELLLCSARTVPDAARIIALINTGVDWRAFTTLAAGHGVRPLVYKTLRTINWDSLPVEIRAEWQQASQSLMGKCLFVTGEMLRLTAAFKAAGIPVAVLKGSVVAEMAYGELALREFNDLDMLVLEVDFFRAVDLLEQSGYRLGWKYGSGNVKRFQRYVGECKLVSETFETEIDLHWRVATKATALSPDISDFPSGFLSLPVAGFTVQSFAPQDLPLYLAAQGGWDQWCDLRRVCDLAEFLRRYPGIDLLPCLNTARRLGGLRSMLTGLSLASILLGAKLPDSVKHCIQSDAAVYRLAEKTIQNLQRNHPSGEPVSRYLFQIQAKKGLSGKLALIWSIFTDRTAEDAAWIMLPQPLWWLYRLLRPLRMSIKMFRRA